uniref:Uncharacterized protein n=1 Tax=Rhizophora mucronata TaxID=61149 RepID=A0A2P2IYA9_RHIMU
MYHLQFLLDIWMLLSMPSVHQWHLVFHELFVDNSANASFFISLYRLDLQILSFDGVEDYLTL